RRGVAAVGDEMWTTRRDRVGLAGAEANLLLEITQEEPNSSLQDVERVLDVGVIVPGHFLARRDLKLGDAKAWTLGVARPALDLVEMARILHAFHMISLLAQPAAGASACMASSKIFRRRAGSVSKVDSDRNTVSMPAFR